MTTNNQPNFTPAQIAEAIAGVKKTMIAMEPHIGRIIDEAIKANSITGSDAQDKANAAWNASIAKENAAYWEAKKAKETTAQK